MQYTPVKSDVQEEELIRFAIAGQLDAFNQLVLKYQDMVYHQAFSLMGERQSAEDIAQESFIRAFQALRSFRGGSFRAWLLRIVSNACYDELRRHKNHSWQPLFAENEDGEEIESSEWLVDQQAFVEEIFDQAELGEQIQQRLNQLPEKYRSVVNLIDVLEMDYTEAAQVLGVPIGTVKSRLARARLQLKGSLAGILALSPAPVSPPPAVMNGRGGGRALSSSLALLAFALPAVIEMSKHILA